ncbi:MAG: thiaminase II [Eubacteriales bacterium]|nr:thiaminase II [Eubacteriales bacterium]
MSFSNELKSYTEELWTRAYEHPFVQELGAGTLSKDKFRFYLKQDYLYLLSYAKVFALGCVKAPEEMIMAKLTESQDAILNGEMNNHRAYMQRMGITKEEVEAARPSLFNSAYTANMLAAGQTGDILDILVTILPCAWSYYDYACRLKKRYATAYTGNFYKEWIDTYTDDAFLESFSWMLPVIDRLAAKKTESERTAVKEIFRQSVALEYLFWDMSYRQEMLF